MSRQGDRTPVIIGVGECLNRPSDPAAGLDATSLVISAIGQAAADAGGSHWLREVDRLSIVDILGRDDRPEPVHPRIAMRLGLAPRHAETSPSPSGNHPVRFLDEAASAIADGSCEVALVAGGEAMRTYARLGSATGKATNGTGVIRAYREREHPDPLVRYGLVAPMDIYPLYEQATRHAWGQSLAEAQAETEAIWAGNARVAAGNPFAWIQTPPAAGLIQPGPENPLLSFPYTKREVANSSVNMAAAILLTSAGKAASLGIPPNQLVHVGYGASADEASGHLDRADFTRSPAMEAALTVALERNELTAADLDLVEFYSCFPCVPKMARRVIGWPLDRAHSIYGGLTFGGGPIGNCMTHALAALVRQIRRGRANGLVFANGGFATRNHAIVLTRDAPPGGRGPLDHDANGRAEAIRGPIPPLIQHSGEGVIESFSIPCSKGEPVGAVIVGRSGAGSRFLARIGSHDPAMLAILITDSSPGIGLCGRAVAAADGMATWKMG